MTQAPTFQEAFQATAGGRHKGSAGGFRLFRYGPTAIQAQDEQGLDLLVLHGLPPNEPPASPFLDRPYFSLTAPQDDDARRDVNRFLNPAGLHVRADRRVLHIESGHVPDLPLPRAGERRRSVYP